MATSDPMLDAFSGLGLAPEVVAALRDAAGPSRTRDHPALRRARVRAPHVSTGRAGSVHLSLAPTGYAHAGHRPRLMRRHLADVERLDKPRRPKRMPQPVWFRPFKLREKKSTGAGMLQPTGSSVREVRRRVLSCVPLQRADEPRRFRPANSVCRSPFAAFLPRSGS